MDCARKCLAEGFNGVCNGIDGNNGNSGIDGIDGNGNDNIKSSCNAFTFLDGVCTLGCIENTTGGQSNDLSKLEIILSHYLNFCCVLMFFRDKCSAQGCCSAPSLWTRSCSCGSRFLPGGDRFERLLICFQFSNIGDLCKSFDVDPQVK